ncbi:MAG: hypothetical protein IID15_09270 [Candidatus Marinimicrobia bacterium]|nr:hypothetical protein [Candidatus Neomarinimicrobiota bacterium]
MMAKDGPFMPKVKITVEMDSHEMGTVLMEKMAAVMASVDVYLSPSFGGNNLLLTNLTGHPCVVLPNGFNAEGTPTSITFMGQLYDEATLLAVARAYQEATQWHKQHPPEFK